MVKRLSRNKQASQKWVVLIFWLSLIAAYWLFAYRNDLSALETLFALWSFFKLPLWGPLIYLLFFSFQPLVFFPSALMGIIGGNLYGPWWGVVITSLGALGAASVTYGTGYFFGLDPEADRFRVLQKFRGQLEEHTFVALIILHLLYMPYDLVNYFAGLLRLPWRPFILSTLVGSVPGIFTFVFLGASLDMEQIDQHGIEINGQMLLLSAGTLVFSLLLSRILKRKTAAGG